MIYPFTVHDLWLALTRLPSFAQSFPVSVGRSDKWYNITAVTMDGPDGGVALEMSYTPARYLAHDLTAAQDDVGKMLTVFEMAHLDPPYGPPPPPIPLTDAVRKLLTDIRARYEHAVEDDEDTIPF